MKQDLPPVLSLRNLSFQFADSDRALLSDVNWDIAEHECVALLGPTGTGKSVLLKLLAGLLSPTRGEVCFQGVSITKMNRSQLRAFRRSLGMTFQKDGLFDSLSCGENLRLPLWEVEKVSGKAADKRVEAALESVELGGQAALRVYEMSGGMQKRLGIARALLFRPSVLLYDEPTAGLDPITSRNILNLILEHQNQAKSTVVLVSSQPSQIERVTDGAAFLFEGRLQTPHSWGEWRKKPETAVGQFLEGRLDGPLTKGMDR